MLRIPLGTYSLDVGNDIKKQFTELRNRVSERHPNRLHAQILLRGRGRRNLYKRVMTALSGGRERANYYRVGSQDLPIEYAQRVAVYLLIKKGTK